MQLTDVADGLAVGHAIADPGPARWLQVWHSRSLRSAVGSPYLLAAVPSFRPTAQLKPRGCESLSPIRAQQAHFRSRTSGRSRVNARSPICRIVGYSLSPVTINDGCVNNCTPKITSRRGRRSATMSFGPPRPGRQRAERAIWPGRDMLRRRLLSGCGEKLRKQSGENFAKPSRTSPFGEKGCAVRNSAVPTSKDSNQ